MVRRRQLTAIWLVQTPLSLHAHIQVHLDWLLASSESLNQEIQGRVREAVADAAYGDGETRRQLAEAERTLVAKVPKPPRNRYFTKQDFPSTWRLAAAPVRPSRLRSASIVRGATTTDTGSGFRTGPSSSTLEELRYCLKNSIEGILDRGPMGSV